MTELDTLFDIAHADAFAMIKIKEDCDFLLDQRKMYLAHEDKELIKKQQRSRLRKTEEERRQKAIYPITASTSATSEVSMVDQTESSAPSAVPSESDDEYVPTTQKIPSRKIQSPVSPQILTTDQLYLTCDKCLGSN